MKVMPIRLAPGSDLRLSLEQVLADHGEQAGWVLCGIGSLSVAPLRLAGQEKLTILEGDLEILTLAGSLSIDGAHLHISLANRNGQVNGGHLAIGAMVRTTAEVLVAMLPSWSFSREMDPDTGFKELMIRHTK
jgi:predicted DNA-binding protein with PD1-like motif